MRDKRGAGSLVAARRGNSRPQNRSCGGKDVRRVVVGNFLFGFQPVLDVAPAELRSVEAQRLATDERNGFRFHLAQMAGSVFTIHKFFGSRMPENNVGNFVECGFVRKCGQRIYGNFAVPCEPLNVAVDFVKRYECKVQSTKRRIQVEAGNRRNVGFFAFGLCEHKPIGTEAKGVAYLWLRWFLLCVVRVRGSLEWHWHTKGYSCFPFADLSFAFQPTAICVQWSGLQVASNALFERKQGIPDAVVVKCGVGCEHTARLFDCISQKFSPSDMLSFWHLCFPLFFLFSSVVFALKKRSNALP